MSVEGELFTPPPIPVDSGDHVPLNEGGGEEGATELGGQNDELSDGSSDSDGNDAGNAGDLE